MSAGIFAQNLVPNYDFESYTSCPTDFSLITATDWYNVQFGGSDYYHECGAAVVGVPDNAAGFQESSTGAAYGGFFTYFSFVDEVREYLQVKLSSPLVAGSCYNLSIVYSPADNGGTASGLGMVLTEDIPTTYTGLTPQLAKPTAGENFTEWHSITTQYNAVGSEEYLTLGNFHDDQNTIWDPPAGGGNFGTAYYYIDSVIVELVNVPELIVDLGEDLDVCTSDFPITITSDVPNAINIWSTGETGTSIIVSGPGNYSVQSLLNCATGVDSINITVFEDPLVEIQDEIICEGDVYLIELDASLGDYEWNDGSQEASFEVTETGTYSVILTYECGDVIESFDVDVLASIDIPEPMNLMLCETQLPYVVSFLEFNDGVNQFLWQDGSSDPGIFIVAGGSYSVEIFNDCFSDVVYFEVEISTEYPDFIDFVDTIICIGEEVLIDPGFIGVDYLWQDGSMLPFLSVSGPGQYAVTVSNFCDTKVFDFTIVEATEITLDLGLDLSICPGDSALISALADLTNVTWSNGDSGTSIWIKEEGQLIATGDGICGEVTDTINILFNGIAPQIDVPDSLLICDGDSLLLTASNDTLGIDFFWNTGENGASITIFEGGNYIVSGQNNCGLVLDSVFVVIGESLPDPLLEDIYEICFGDTIELSIQTNGGDVMWSTGTIDSFIQIFEEGTYSVSITNSCNTKNDSVVLVFTEELSDFNLGADLGICQGDSISIMVNGVDGIYQWSTGSSDEIISVDEIGMYSLEISGECNVVTDSIEVIDLGAIPEIDLGSDIVFCNGDSVIIGVGSANVDEVLWNTSSIENSITVFTAGTYIVFGNNACGTASDTIVLTINNEVPQIDLGVDQQLCPGDTVILDLGNVAGEILWNTGESGTSIQVFDGGEYYAVTTSSCGISRDTVVVELQEVAPTIDLGDDQILCAGDSLEFDITVGNATDVEWNNGINTTINSFTESGVIWVELSNNCGVVNDSINLEIVPLVDSVNLGEDALVCDVINFEILSGVTQTDVNVLWNTDETSEDILITESGAYWLQVSNSCFSISDTIVIDFGDSPSSFDLGLPDTICKGQSVLLEGFQGDQFDYQWQDNSVTSDFVASETGTYELVVNNECGAAMDEFQLTVLENEIIDIALQDSYFLCAGDSLEIDLSGILADIVEWNDGSNDRFRILTQPGFYSIEFTNICSDTLSSFLIEEENCFEGGLYIPNTFTPNGDGINDIFGIELSDNWLSPKLKFSIYNRWGEKMFYSEAINFSWDGSFKDVRLNSGVYIYYLELNIEVEGETQLIQKAGNITIVK